MEGEVVESFAENKGGRWTGWQVWGFADEGGERWFVRRFVIRKMGADGGVGKEVVRVRLCYAWAGGLDE